MIQNYEYLLSKNCQNMDQMNNDWKCRCLLDMDPSNMDPGHKSWICRTLRSLAHQQNRLELLTG